MTHSDSIHRVEFLDMVPNCPNTVMDPVQPQEDLQPTLLYVPPSEDPATADRDCDATLDDRDRTEPMAAEEPDDRQIGPYRLKYKLGAGGMGEVYEAEHRLLKRPCALKLIKPGTRLGPATLDRFQREVRAAAQLTHWNTVQIYDYGCTPQGTFYYVMELLPGLDLHELVKRYGPLPPERVVHLIVQTCSALREAHGIGLVHRDIKPANVFAAYRGGLFDVAKLLDFGLVREPTPRDAWAVSSLGRRGLSGSPLYMSPEQAAAFDRADARSDIYSLGAVGYYLLTGVPPFAGTDALEVISAHAHTEVIPPAEHRHDTPSDVEEIVLRCLAKHPGDRFPDAEGLRQALWSCRCAGRWTERRAAVWWRGVLRAGHLSAGADESFVI